MRPRNQHRAIRYSVTWRHNPRMPREQLVTEVVNITAFIPYCNSETTGSSEKITMGIDELVPHRPRLRLINQYIIVSECDYCDMSPGSSQPDFRKSINGEPLTRNQINPMKSWYLLRGRVREQMRWRVKREIDNLSKKNRKKFSTAHHLRLPIRTSSDHPASHAPTKELSDFAGR